MIKLKDYIFDCTVKFLYYRDMELWYEVHGGPTHLRYPVPIGDLGTAMTFAQEKAIVHMSYIRRQINLINQ